MGNVNEGNTSRYCGNSRSTKASTASSSKNRYSYSGLSSLMLHIIARSRSGSWAFGPVWMIRLGIRSCIDGVNCRRLRPRGEAGADVCFAGCGGTIPEHTQLTQNCGDGKNVRPAVYSILYDLLEKLRSTAVRCWVIINIMRREDEPAASGASAIDQAFQGQNVVPTFLQEECSELI